MKLEITGRDLKFFILGVTAMLLFVIIYDWSDFKRGFLGEPTETKVISEQID